MESIEMKRVTVCECAVHIKENGLDGAQIWERSVSRVSAHRDSSNLDRLCRGMDISICHHIETLVENCSRLQVDEESMRHNAFMTYIERLSVQGIMESLPAAYFWHLQELTVLLRHLRAAAVTLALCDAEPLLEELA